MNHATPRPETWAKDGYPCFVSCDWHEPEVVVRAGQVLQPMGK